MNKKKVVSIEDRIPKLKQARKKKANRRLIFYLSVFFVLISIIIYLQSSLSDVRYVAVSGNAFLEEQYIKEQSGLSKKDNFWSVDKNKVETSIKNNPLIKSVQVSKKFPSTIRIEVEEYDRVAYVKVNGSWSPILETGKVLDKQQGEPSLGDAPLLSGFTKEIYLKEMTNELNALSDRVVDLISEIEWQPQKDNPYRIILYMNDGFLVEASIRNFSKRMQLYPSIASQIDASKKGSGVIHIGVGAYFQEFSANSDEEMPKTKENENEVEG
ncbi:cell division protein FtsQ/DivIB [Aquibacillus sp. 3ASR75-11]|uniref:Cell division protein DivIB n=1 Tax=Terrihalobacillus insolitus TaxID=2950438 RepID=A0A9X3WUL4_9BACI|nr:cell division protein FtsQ/DivIB [Terrihalobacillus insolitus]MDC3412835.1 cell division protein FtsQ/DivIB [Terrihalobacillus insolitus]MDC3423689.1 cell division protein FtsQ/DivIB [Terrihalobacillus insolitus]